MKKYFSTWMLCAVVVLAALAFLIMKQYMFIPGTSATLSYGGEKEMRIPLNQDKTYDVESNGYTIHIQVKDGQVAFVDSPCPDHLCEHFGWLDTAGDMAVCLPAAAMLTIGGETG